MEKNRLRIIADPYNNTICYRRWSEEKGENGEWVELDENSPLLRYYTKATIQNVASDMVDLAVKNYDRGNFGLEINFAGTQEDYEDLLYAVSCRDKTENVSCIQDETVYMDSAAQVMPKVKKIFESLNSLVKEHETSSVKDIIGKFDETTSPVVPIIVTGTYSAGKSTFINALLGKEILPSAMDPTTALVYRISGAKGSEAGEVRFYCGGEIIVKFDGKSCRGEGIAELPKVLREAVKKPSGSVERDMNSFLKALNEHVKNEKNPGIQGLVCVNAPFTKGVLADSNCEIIIYDTPGSNAAQYQDHSEILKEALRDQTNSLPVIVTDMKGMGTDDAKKLLETVKKLGKGLDCANPMVIVSQADGLTPTDLEKNSGGVLAEWSRNRMYFVSAIVGLGSKKPEKDMGWLDSHYEMIFEDKKSRFCDPQNKFYRKLYDYNQTAESALERYREKTDRQAENEQQLLYRNSGLEFVEMEIVEYARRFALYNKCARAKEYLKEALAKIEEQIKEKETREDEQRQLLQNRLSES